MIRSISGALAHKRSELGQKEKGFTLIELLVVVIIIGILAAIAIPIFLGQQTSARDSAVKSDITNAKTAVVAFMVANNGALPASNNLTLLTDFTASDDVTLKLVGTTAAFCIEGFSITNGTGALKYSATDKKGVKQAACV